jgi:hypothetical protein
MKTERTLMCLMFALCTVLVAAAVFAMLTSHVAPVQFAHAAAAHLPSG